MEKNDISGLGDKDCPGQIKNHVGPVNLRNSIAHLGRYEEELEALFVLQLLMEVAEALMVLHLTIAQL